ncbi:ATP-binding protein [Rouxiella sp. T17]|uniref:ATP-binding protein n=1 Tax=Rouxiella sp. T17 TaxID=3085684 RepID=UPI002FC8CB72
MSLIGIEERALTAVTLGESHFREFKSALQGPPEKKEKRPTKDISTNIAQTLVAFANADGGELLIGVEDNGEITGINDFNDTEINTLLDAPRVRVHIDTPLNSVRKKLITIENKRVIYFSVEKSTEVIHITSDGRCLQRKDLESVPVPHENIKFDRQDKLSREYDRQFIDAAKVDDLDIDLIRTVSDVILKGMSPEKCLQYLNLAEFGTSKLNLRRASLLLFSKEYIRWHPRLQVRIIRVDGTELLTGKNYNVVMDEAIGGNILNLVDKSWEALRPHLVQTKIDKSARFEQKTIYPELACREALLNAIAHRDYSQEGKGVEVYIFNDRLEFKSPGALLSTIRIKDIINQTGAHQSRNTYIARVLRELGYMRELGEGMRRIYQLMQENELTPPEIRESQDGFSITLFNKPIYSNKEALFLEQFDRFNLDKDMKAVILLGIDEAVFSAQNIWDVVGIVDTEHYRRLVEKLWRLKILENKVDRELAKKISRKEKTPFKKYPRYSISFPSRSPQTTQSTVIKNTTIISGKVKNVYPKGFFGFVVDEKGNEYYFRLSENKTNDKLAVDQPVKFQISHSKRGDIAINITN